MKELIQSWLNDEIDGDITVDGRELTLVYSDGCYEVWEDGELIAHTDNAKDFLNVGGFIGIKTLTYEEFKSIVEANAMNDQWLFSEGWELIHKYPEYSDRFALEHIQRAFDKEVQE